MSLTYRKRNRVIEEFIELYKSEPCLWRVKSKEYHNRSMKEAAYAKLLAKLRECEPDAVRDSVVRKINSLRSNIRKEQRKIWASIRSGAPPEHVYKPSLWYYNLFSFLKDRNKTDGAGSNSPDEERSGSDEDNGQGASGSWLNNQNAFENEETNDEASTPSTRLTEKRSHPYSRPRDTEGNITKNSSDELLLLVREYLRKPQEVEDRYDHFGKMVAMRLRGLQMRQGLVAEKMINDILFEAEMASIDNDREHNVEQIKETKPPYSNS